MSIQTSHPPALEKLTNGVMESSKDKSDLFGKSSGEAATASTSVVVPIDQKWNVSSECPPPIDFSTEGLQDNSDGKGSKSNQPKGGRSKNKKANWKPLQISITTNDTRERDIRGGSTTRGEIKVNHHHNKFRDKKQPQQNNQQQQPMQQSQQQHQQTAPSNHNNNNRNHTHHHNFHHHSNSHQPHYHHSHHHQNNNHHHNNQNHNSYHLPSSGSSSSAGAAAQSNPTASETTEEASKSKATPVGGGSAGGHRWSSSSLQNSGNNSANSTTTSNTTPRKSQQQQHNQVPHYTNSNDSSSSSSYYHPSGYSRVNSVGSSHGGGNKPTGKGNNSNSLPPKSSSSNLNNNSSSNHRSNNYSVHHRNRGPNHYHQYNNNGSKGGSEIASSSAGPSSIAGGSTPGGSGRATPINGFVPAMISAVPIEYTAGGGVSPHTIDQGVGVPPPQATPVYYVVSTLPPSSDPKNPSVGAGGTTTATLSPVLSVPPGTVVVPTPSFAVTGPTAVSASTNLAPFYAPNVLTTFTTIPTTASGTAAVAPAGVAVAPTAVPFIPPPHPHHHHAHHPHAHPIHAHHIHGVVTPLVPAVPVDPDELMDKIRSQIEYYFSEANLQKDVFIRKKMDSQGFLPISLIASFHRVQSLTQDVAMIIKSLEDSSELELSESRLKVRPRINPTIWPLRDEVSNTSSTITPTCTSSGNELTTTSS